MIPPLTQARDLELACDFTKNICTIYTKDSFCGVDESPNIKLIPESGKVILNCECNCTAQENQIWIGDINSKSVNYIKASKVVGSDQILGINKIPDTFGAVPFCQKVEAQKKLLLALTKVPTNQNPNPYCYSVVEINSQNLTVCNPGNCGKANNWLDTYREGIKSNAVISYESEMERKYINKEGIEELPKRGFLERFIPEDSYSKSNSETYNNIGFYWQQSGYAKDAIWLLEIVAKNDPSRVVVYLNLADAFWDNGDKSRSKEYYTKYINLMTQYRSKNKIPKRAVERAKYHN